MNAVPKCTSWRGHKFEGRYDYSPHAGKISTPIYYSAGETILVLKALATITYVRDVCVRCGFVIERGLAQ